MTALGAPIQVFCSFARKDAGVCSQLHKHLRPLEQSGMLTLWHKRLITAGTDWTKAIDEHLTSSDIILLLISPSFFASDYCYGVEMEKAMQRHTEGTARVIPILVRDVKWESAPFARLTSLPRDGEFLPRKRNRRDTAFANIATELLCVIEELVSQKAEEPEQNEEIDTRGKISPPVGPGPKRKIPPLKKPSPFLPRNWAKMTAILVLAVLLLISGGGYAWSLLAGGVRGSTTPTPTISIPDIPHPAGWVPMPRLLEGYDWTNSKLCSIQSGSGAYNVSLTGQNYCRGTRATFYNVAFQVKMSIFRGTEAGIIFHFYRKDPTAPASYYYYSITTNGMYHLYFHKSPGKDDVLCQAFSSHISQGLSQPNRPISNQIGLLANGIQVSLYINGYYIPCLHNNSQPVILRTEGSQLLPIGVAVNAPNGQGETDVKYENFKVWIQ